MAKESEKIVRFGIIGCGGIARGKHLCKLRITSYELRIVKSSCPLNLRNPKCKL